MEDNTSALLRMIPSELLFSILTQVDDPVDLAYFSLASKTTYDYCHPNPHLWKTTFLRHFDPLPFAEQATYDYKQALETRIRARGLIHLAKSGQLSRIVSAYDSLIPTFVALARSAASPMSLNTQFLLELFPPDSSFTAQYLAAALNAAQDDSSAIQAVAEFRMRYGHVWDTFRPPAVNRAIRSVYTKSHYTAASNYGPYLHDGSGRVDWALAEKIRTVMVDNVRDAQQSEEWGETNDGEKVVLPGVKAWADSARGSTSWTEDPRDWAGVQSNTIGTYVFCDWTSFELINRPGNVPIPASQLRRQGVGECQSIVLTLDPSCPSPTPTTPYPRLTFTGTLKSRDVAPTPDYPSLSISGFVERTPDGAIRWQYRVRYNGREQWRLEGVQIGEERSRMGVVGIWTHAPGHDGEEGDGPCGPFWWFVPEEV